MYPISYLMAAIELDFPRLEALDLLPISLQEISDFTTMKFVAIIQHICCCNCAFYEASCRILDMQQLFV